MKIAKFVLFAAVASGAAVCVSSAQAAVCPTTPYTGNNSTYGGCNLVVQFNANGSIQTFAPPGATLNYDGSDDALIGVVNDTINTIFNFSINGGSSDIFGFDGDGIDTFTGIGPIAGNPDTSGYGGPDGYYTNIVGNTGTVNFDGGIAAGATNYFSLEEAINLNAPPIITAVPEPASMTILAFGLLGAGLARRRLRRGPVELGAGITITLSK